MKINKLGAPETTSPSSPPEPTVLPANFRRRKFYLALWIMGVGMAIALVWNAYQGWGLGRTYPDNTFLFPPKLRFGDFTAAVFFSSRPVPYEDPYAVYFPFALVCLRAFSPIPPFLGVLLFLSAALGGLYFLLVKVLASVIPSPWKRTLLSLLFLGTSYPLLFCIDRGNIELFVVALAGASLFFFSRNNYIAGMLCLLPGISFKLYPALFLLLLIRQRKIRLTLCTGFAFLAITFFSIDLLSLPIGIAWSLFNRDMAFFTHAYIYENFTLEGSATLWNVYKVALIYANDVGLINPVDFSFDSNMVHLSQVIFSCFTSLLALVMAIYVCFVEREFLRCAIALLFFLTMATPAGADYRLLYANIALILLILLKTRRPYDMVILVLIALTMVPKKELILTYAGRTDSGFNDVSIQVVLNPLFVLFALFLLLYDSRATFDLGWSRLRFFALIRAIFPSLYRKVPEYIKINSKQT